MRITGPEIRQATGYELPSAELVAGIFRLVKARSAAGLEPPSVRQLAAHLRHDIGPIKRGCEMLEAHAVVSRAWCSQKHTSPSYRITPDGNWAAGAGAQFIGDSIQAPLADVIARSWARYFGITLNLASLAIGAWERTTEDVTALVCVGGQVEGSVAFGMSRRFLFKSLASSCGHDFNLFDRNVKRYFQTLIDHVADDVGREIAAAGFDVVLSPAATVVNRGALLSKPRDVRHLITLTSGHGQMKVRVTLRDVS